MSCFNFHLEKPPNIVVVGDVRLTPHSFVTSLSVAALAHHLRKKFATHVAEFPSTGWFHEFFPEIVRETAQSNFIVVAVGVGGVLAFDYARERAAENDVSIVHLITIDAPFQWCALNRLKWLGSTAHYSQLSSAAHPWMHRQHLVNGRHRLLPAHAAAPKGSQALVLFDDTKLLPFWDSPTVLKCIQTQLSPYFER